MNIYTEYADVYCILNWSTNPLNEYTTDIWPCVTNLGDNQVHYTDISNFID